MRARKSSRTAVEIWPRRLWAGTMTQWHNEYNAERMCLASFVAGLNGIVCRHTRIANPQSMQQAFTIALAATEAMRQEKASEIFFAKTSGENSEQAHDSRTGTRQNRSSRNASAKPQKRGRRQMLRV